MTRQQEVVIKFFQQDIQWVEQAVLDADAQSALEFLREVAKPRLDSVLNRPHCKPVFEWGAGEEPRVTGPPDRPR